MSKSLDERINSFPTAWKPKVGDKLVGEITELDERTSEFGTYPIVGVVTDDGDEFAFHAFHTVAKNELVRQRPRLGDKIGIKYFGRDAEQGYERYRILVEHVAPAEGDEPSWDQMAQESAAELVEDPGAWPEEPTA